ncbi:hypothetical protein [uncultured Paraburkholderia sp.]|nr:hypothetical protein [uncultured Paraburkholderia sp.]
MGQQLDPGRQEDYYREHRGRHHALMDARANRHAMMGSDPAPDTS